MITDEILRVLEGILTNQPALAYLVVGVVLLWAIGKASQYKEARTREDEQPPDVTLPKDTLEMLIENRFAGKELRDTLAKMQHQIDVLHEQEAHEDKDTAS